MKVTKRHLRESGRRKLSLLMAIIMCLSLIQINLITAVAAGSVEEQESKQISPDWDGGTVYYKGDGSGGSSADWAVKLTRTLEATGTENLFNVNMEVVTKDGEIEVTNSSAAVSLVLDTSGSMRYCSECGYNPGTNRDGSPKPVGPHQGCSSTTSRLDAAKAAIIDFLNSYAKDKNGNFYSSPRMVSLVTFAGKNQTKKWDLSNAAGTQHWVNVNNQAALDYVTSLINGNDIYAYGGTNTDAGMLYASELLNTTTYSEAIGSIDNRFCILLTDGVPTYYLDSYGGQHGPGGYATTDTTSHAQESCEKVTATGADLYSIAYGLSGDTVPVSGVGNVPIIIKNNEGVVTGGWLKEYCGSTAVYDANSSQALIDALINILTQTSQSTTFTNGVTGSIGEFTGEVNNGAYDFISFLNGNVVVPSPYNGASVTGNKLQWDLSEATFVRDEVNKTTTYTLSYQVRLNNNIDGFLDWDDSGHADAAEYNVGNASLKYTYTNTEGQQTESEVPFPAIKAHGYLAEFDFMKIAKHEDENGDPIYLDGAPFQLSNLAKPELYREANTIVKNTTSQTSQAPEILGKVAFAAIPSGYSYTLSETGEFESGGRVYEPISQTWTIAVNYGVLTGAPTGNVENTLKQIPIELELTKTWQVPNAESTTAITVNLKRSGTPDPVAILTLNGSSASSSDSTNYPVAYNAEKSTSTKWVYTVTVPSINQETGGTYVYSVEEQSLPGFSTTYGQGGLSITNTITGTTTVSVKKEWLPIDGKEMNSKPPVVVTLLANGSATSNTVTLSDANNWFHTFTGLDRYDAQGQVISYTVSEANGTYQYVSLTGNGTEANPFVFTNTVTDSTIEVPVSKTWNDADASARPNVTVELLRDGKSFSLVEGQDKTTYTLTSADAIVGNSNIWAHTFEGLPQYQFTYEDGVITAVHEYVYSVAELTVVDGYTSIKDTSNGLNLINTRAQKVSIEVTKEWKDNFNNHNEVTIKLLQNGNETDKFVTLSADNNWTDTFDNLNQFDIDGVPYVYTVTESPVPERYTVSYNYGDGNSAVVFGANHVGNVTVTNTLKTDDSTIDVQVTKVWRHPAGTGAPDVTFTLIQKDAKGNIVDANFRTKTLTANDATTFTFSGLPKFYYEQEADPDTGEIVVHELEYQYFVTESPIAGYDNGKGVAGVQEGNSWTFTNTITGDITLEVEKVWQGLGTDFPNAEINLMRNDGSVDSEGEPVWEIAGTWTTNVNGSETWTVPKYNSVGAKYTYKVVEKTVPGYNTSYSPENATYTADVNKIIVTNQLAQSTFNFVASKTWVDNGNAYDTRKDITLTLYQKANGVENSLGTVIIGAEGTLAGGTYAGSVSVTKNDNRWEISFSSLPKYAYDDEGNVYEFTYRVTEDAVEGYTTVIARDKDITNTLKQTTVDITIHKTWVDPADKEHPNVTFKLEAKAGGSPVTSVTGYEAFPRTVTLGFSDVATVPKASNAEDAADATVTGDDWYYTWKNLPKYDDNQRLITYTVTEQAVSGYDSVQPSAFTFVNTIKQENLNFEGTKEWNMGEQDGFLNPEAQPVTIGLYYVDADGNLGQLVVIEGLTNPVEVNPVADESGIKGTFSFNNLPRYNLSSGEEFRYTIREVAVTTGEGGTGYTPIEDGGALTLTVYDEGKPFSYKYTVNYNSIDGETVTNTYNDPEAYFYKIIGNYYTFYSNDNTLIYQNEGVNLNEGGVPYISLTKEEWEELSSKIITADTTLYTEHNSLDFVFDNTNPSNVVSVELEQVNHMYVIKLNYVRRLYKLTVNYVFPEGDKPDSGFENYSDPNGLVLGDPDPGKYLGNDLYKDTHKAAPVGFILNKVTVKDSENAAREEDTNYNGGSFHDYDVIVTYYYLRNISEEPDVTDPGFTILKTTDGEAPRPITHDAATFQLFVDEECTMPVTGGMDIFTAIDTGKVEIKASELGEGTWYLKEVGAPSGYTPADTVWKIVVTCTRTQELVGNKFVNKIVWTLEVTTLDGENALDEDGFLSVPNDREYGYLIITKIVTGLQQNEDNTFEFMVTGNSHGGNYSETYSIPVTGNSTASTELVRIPTGTYVVAEIPASALISGYIVNTSYSTENGAVTVTTGNIRENPANVTVTNEYEYDNPDNNKTTIRGSKIWEDDGNRDGLRPASIRLELHHDGKAIPGVNTVDVPATAADQSYQFTYDHYLYPGTVTVQEVGYTDAEGVYHEGEVPGYEVSPGLAPDYNVTNAYDPETIIIEVEKIWAGGSPTRPVTLRLHANGTALPNDVIVLDGTMDEGGAPEYDAWKGIFPGNFYKYENGEPIIYTVTEDPLGSEWRQNISGQEALMDGEYLYGYLFIVTNSYDGGYGGGDDYYYRIDYVYTGRDADGNVIYSDMTTGTVQETTWAYYSFISDATVDHDGHSFDLVGEASQGANLMGTSLSKPHVFTVYYEFTGGDIEIPDDDEPLGDIEIPDEEVPLADVPQTGDDSRIKLFISTVTALISAFALVVLIAEDRKRKSSK